MTPLERYESSLQKQEIFEDRAQKDAVEYTQALYEDLVKSHEQRPGFWKKLFDKYSGRSRENIRGLYFWGGVGRGKTCIVDIFFDCLPFEEKKRIHFHRFMQMVHHELKQLHQVQSPLKIIAETLVSESRVICFDEFHVSDITDAMLLGGLLRELFERGMVLVATSNEHPDELYLDGLQREKFLPAIELIKQHTRVINLDSGIDYRLMYLDKAEIYHSPLDENAERMLLTSFMHIAPDQGRQNSTIEIEGRKIPAVRNANGVVWFDFRAICDGPRGAADYIEISRQFQTVLISCVPVLGDDEIDIVSRFMAMVDEFYDRNVKLILTAEKPADEIYVGKRLAKKFKRTTSRLFEMQSHDYLSSRHLSE